LVNDFLNAASGIALRILARFKAFASEVVACDVVDDDDDTFKSVAITTDDDVDKTLDDIKFTINTLGCSDKSSKCRLIYMRHTTLIKTSPVVKSKVVT
jgi:Uri superfamily endonuclease